MVSHQLPSSVGFDARQLLVEDFVGLSQACLYLLFARVSRFTKHCCLVFLKVKTCCTSFMDCRADMSAGVALEPRAS